MHSHMHTPMLAHMHTHMLPHMHTHTFTHMHTHIHTHAHSYAHSYAHSHANSHTTQMHTHIFTLMHTLIKDAQMQTHMHKCIPVVGGEAAPPPLARPVDTDSGLGGFGDDLSCGTCCNGVSISCIN